LATQATAIALLFYAVGLFAYAGVKVVVPVFYSLQDTKTPVKIAIYSMLANIVLNIILMQPLKHAGLAFATALASMLNFVLLLYYLRKKMGRLGGRQILISCLKIIAASIVMGIVAWILINQYNFMMLSRLSSGIVLLGIILISVILYAVISFLLKSSEMSFLLYSLRKKT